MKKAVETSSKHLNSFTEATFNYFCQLIKNGRCSFKAKAEGAKILEKILGDRLHDIDFQSWLVEKLWLKDRDELAGFLEYSSSDVLETPRGCRHQSFEERERAYNFSKLNSEISIHRSNDRHMVKISE